MPNLILEISKKKEKVNLGVNQRRKRTRECKPLSIIKMPIEKAKEYIDTAIESEWSKLIISCDELSYYDSLIDLLEYSRSKNMDIQLYTTGNKLNTQMLEGVYRAGLRALIIPLQSLNYSFHNKMYSGRPGFYEILQGINILRDMKIAGFELVVRMQFVLSKYNYQMLPSLLQYGLASRFDVFEIMFEKNNSAPEKNSAMSREDIERFFKKTLSPIKKIIQKNTISNEHKKRNMEVIGRMALVLEDDDGDKKFSLSLTEQRESASIIIDPSGSIVTCDEVRYYSRLPLYNNNQGIDIMAPKQKGDLNERIHNGKYQNDIESLSIHYFKLDLK